MFSREQIMFPLRTSDAYFARGKEDPHSLRIGALVKDRDDHFLIALVKFVPCTLEVSTFQVLAGCERGYLGVWLIARVSLAM
jgi:hypothetical protein